VPSPLNVNELLQRAGIQELVCMLAAAISSHRHTKMTETVLYLTLKSEIILYHPFNTIKEWIDDLSRSKRKNHYKYMKVWNMTVIYTVYVLVTVFFNFMKRAAWTFFWTYFLFHRRNSYPLERQDWGKKRGFSF